MRRFVFISVVVFALAFVGTAGASQLIARNASDISLQVNSKGKALVTYRSRGRVTHLIAWGAVNARPRPASASGPRQVKLKLDYSGGWGPWRKLVWKHFKNACQPYDGPELAWFVTACKAPDGSYWALQSWQTALPDLGFVPWMKQQRTWWLHLSHWSGPLAVLDGYGRLVFLDTHNSIYGPGWARENSFVSSGPPGLFCYGFYRFNPYVNGYAHPRGIPHSKRGPGTGDMYRLTATGPGVTPDVAW